MPHRTSRSGFSLVETLIASSIATIVLGALMCSFVFCYRMFHRSMAEAEASLAIRELRDKLLFHAGPGMNSGLLTGKASADAASITMAWTPLADDSANRKPEKIRLVWQTGSDGLGNFFNERVPHTTYNQKWFKPGGFLSSYDWTHTVDLPRINLQLVNSSDADILASAWILLPQ